MIDSSASKTTTLLDLFPKLLVSANIQTIMIICGDLAATASSKSYGLHSAKYSYLSPVLSASEHQGCRSSSPICLQLCCAWWRQWVCHVVFPWLWKTLWYILAVCLLDRLPQISFVTLYWQHCQCVSMSGGPDCVWPVDHLMYRLPCLWLLICRYREHWIGVKCCRYQAPFQAKKRLAIPLPFSSTLVWINKHNDSDPRVSPCSGWSPRISLNVFMLDLIAFEITSIFYACINHGKWVRGGREFPSSLSSRVWSRLAEIEDRSEGDGLSNGIVILQLGGLVF